MEHVVLKIEYLDHKKILLTNSRGDTYSSKSEELKDFLHNEPIEDSGQDEYWNEVVARIAAADLMAKVTPGDNEALSKWKKKAIDLLSKQYHLIKK